MDRLNPSPQERVCFILLAFLEQTLALQAKVFCLLLVERA
jgi:hypothetical protein